MSVRYGPARGFSLLELSVGMSVLGTLTLALAFTFRAGLVSARRSMAQLELLQGLRAVAAGRGDLPGVAKDLRTSAKVVAVSSTTLTLENATGVRTIYERTPSGGLLVTRGAQSELAATGLESLSFTFYARTTDYAVVETTSPANARLVTASFAIAKDRRTVRDFAAGGLRSRP